MNIRLVCIGKIKEKYIVDGIAEFQKRMKLFVNLEIIELKEYTKENNIKISMDKESEDIIKCISKFNSYEILLDLNGKEFSSNSMSAYIENLKISGINDITFIIGGSNGVNKLVRDNVRLLLKFSDFTFPHQLMRLIFMEQLYRWFTITNNIKYHK